jgi:predicted nucleic acid-binding protein
LKSGVKVVVADANVLLAAIAGKAARHVFLSEIEIFTTEHTWKEVERYLPRFIEMYNIPEANAFISLQTAPVEIKSRQFYEISISKANKLIGKRDPNDVDILALALTLECPLWTNDKDFNDLGLALYPTAKLLKMLGM